MKIVVLGSGVIGVTSAYYLARAGHQVTVIDRQPGPALETSFANAGEISPGYSSPWAAPGIPQKAIKWLLMKNAPLILQPQLNLEVMQWLFGILRNCTSARYAVNKSRMVRLSEYSHHCLKELRAETGISYDGREKGTLQLFRTQKQLDDIGKDTEVLSQCGIPFEVLDVDGCARAEPALSYVKSKIKGGLRLPNDETGDCFKFTSKLADMAQALGVEFKYNTTVEAIEQTGNHIRGVVTNNGLITADKFVLALGSYSPILARSLGIKLPIYPIKGYSLTLSITDADQAPVSTLMDESYKIAITRLGDRVRVGGMAEVSGYNNRLPKNRCDTLMHSVSDLFPKSCNFEDANYWSGLRPMTPDGTPIVGATSVENLYLNTGHGTLGWTMACGSGQLLADIISGRATAIQHDDLSVSRYS